MRGPEAQRLGGTEGICVMGSGTSSLREMKPDPIARRMTGPVIPTMRGRVARWKRLAVGGWESRRSS